MEALGVSGLAEAASKVMAMAASVPDTMAAAPFLPAKTMSIALGDAATELPTLCHLQVFAQNNPDWYIFYHHIKCATRSDNLCRVWRECMTRRLVLGWRHCVALLDSGCDSVGCHWLTPEQYPALVQSPFWAATSGGPRPVSLTPCQNCPWRETAFWQRNGSAPGSGGPKSLTYTLLGPQWSAPNNDLSVTSARVVNAQR